MKERILIVDSGGARSHAFAWKLAQSPHVGEIRVIPGNGGTAVLQKTENVPTISPTDTQTIVAFAKEFKPHLTIVSSDDSLAHGVTDALRKAGFRVFGPTRAAAQIEWSKIYSKRLMQKIGIRTPPSWIFEKYLDARKFIEKWDWGRASLVIKKDGLAQGKGVRTCKTFRQAEETLYTFMKNGNGTPASAVVIDKYIPNGQELSMHAFVSGTSYLLLPFSQDNKHLRNGRQGPMTGGMGGYMPVRWMEHPNTVPIVEKAILDPVLHALKNDGHPFQGLLYPGLMSTLTGLEVLEFNARPGDPEWAMYMTMMKNDLHELLSACVDGTIAEHDLEWHPGYAVCVVLTARGYVEKNKRLQTRCRIHGLEEAEKMRGITIFHAGTMYEKGRFRTNGGRVLAVVGRGKTLEAARKNTYNAVEKIYFKDMHYRQDIGTV